MNVSLEKALIPYEIIIIAEALLKPRFISNICDFKNILGFNLRLVEGSFVSEYGVPTSSKWFHLRISPIWSSYEAGDKENLYRITITYREEKLKLINFIENIESILKKLLEGV
jgi:hypothetical protein